MVTDAVAGLYGEVDARAAAVAGVHRSTLQCKRGCHECCCDEITVYEVEAEFIRERHVPLLETEMPHATGYCAFLDESGGCRIYPDRPYVCRTQGLPLHWTEERDDGTVVALRDICPENDPHVTVASLHDEDCWIIGPFEERLALLQYAKDGGRMRRVPLRSLFTKRINAVGYPLDYTD